MYDHDHEPFRPYYNLPRRRLRRFTLDLLEGCLHFAVGFLSGWFWMGWIQDVLRAVFTLWPDCLRWIP